MKVSDYPPLDGLVDLACRDGVDVRPTLLRVLTDLYVQKPTHSADEETQYVELALGLIETVDDATRAGVAASLANYKAAPAAILARLGGNPARPMHDPVETTKAEAEAAPKSGHGDDLLELFFSADSNERRLILIHLDAAAGASSAPEQPGPGDVLRRLENAALQRNSGEFSRALAGALRIGPDLALRITRDASGEPIVVAAKALGMKASVLQRILLFINPAVGQSVRRVYELADLFDELSRGAAEHMVGIWRGHDAAARPVYEPVYLDDMAGNARAQTTPATYRPARERTVPPPLGKIIG